MVFFLCLSSNNQCLGLDSQLQTTQVSFSPDKLTTKTGQNHFRSITRTLCEFKGLTNVAAPVAHNLSRIFPSTPQKHTNTDKI